MKRARITNGELTRFERIGLSLAAFWCVAATFLTVRNLL
jgi:hypothetical protein